MRTELWTLSGKTGVYPQVFVRDGSSWTYKGGATEIQVRALSVFAQARWGVAGILCGLLQPIVRGLPPAKASFSSPTLWASVNVR